MNFYDFLQTVTYENVAKEMPETYLAKDVKKEKAIVFWSSGTTGLPKGISHSHYSAWNLMGQLPNEFPFYENVVTTQCFFHVGGFMTAMTALKKRQEYFHVSN